MCPGILEVTRGVRLHISVLEEERLQVQYPVLDALEQGVEWRAALGSSQEGGIGVDGDWARCSLALQRC